MSYILHIDTSTDTGVYVLSENGKVIAAQQGLNARDHAATINIHIKNLLGEAGISLKHLSAVAVCAGPGSYTGLRIGLATAKGYCYAGNIPLLLQNKLTLLASQHQDLHQYKYRFYIAILRARAEEVFMTIVNADGITVFEPKHAMLAEAEQLLLEHPKSLVVTDLSTDETGKHTELNYVVHDTQIVTPYWAIMAFQEYKCKKTVNLSTAEPFYLKQVYTHK